MSAATVVALLLPGSSASASTPAGDDSPAADPSEAGTATLSEVGPSGPGHADAPSVAPLITPDSVASPGARIQNQRRHQSTVAALQPPVQAPVRAPRVKSHSRSGAS